MKRPQPRCLLSLLGPGCAVVMCPHTGRALDVVPWPRRDAKGLTKPLMYVSRGPRR